MYETNVLGTMRMTRALLPQLIESGNGHVVGVTSIAAFETYRGGAGYTAAKHAQRATLRTLRLELLGEPVSVTDVAPGMVETEFSLVRFEGDAEAAAKVYEGMEPLRAEDVAECIRWAVTQPAHVNIDEILVRPRDQARATEVHRRGKAGAKIAPMCRIFAPSTISSRPRPRTRSRPQRSRRAQGQRLYQAFAGQQGGVRRRRRGNRRGHGEAARPPRHHGAAEGPRGRGRQGQGALRKTLRGLSSQAQPTLT